VELNVTLMVTFTQLAIIYLSDMMTDMLQKKLHKQCLERTKLQSLSQLYKHDLAFTSSSVN